MRKINSESDLKAAIMELEALRADQAYFLKEEIHQVYDTVKPINLLKGAVTGLVTKLVFQGTTKNPVKKILGTVLMFGITQLIAKNPDAIKSIGQKVFNFFRSKSAKKVHVSSETVTE